MIKRLINTIFKKQSKSTRSLTAGSSIKNGEEVQEQAEKSRIAEISREQVTEMERIKQRLAKLEAELEKAVSSYRLLLIRENPEVLPELVQGESIEALEHSLAAARELTARMKQKLEQQMAAEHIPPGAPARTIPGIENMSPGEKIRYGLQKIKEV